MSSITATERRELRNIIKGRFEVLAESLEARKEELMEQGKAKVNQDYQRKDTRIIDLVDEINELKARFTAEFDRWQNKMHNAGFKTVE